MEIRYNKHADNPLLIDDLVEELMKGDFIHFKILCANEVHHFHNDDDSIITFERTYMKESKSNGDRLYIAYPDIFRVKLYRDMDQYLEDEKKADAFNEVDWTGNRIIF